MKKLIILPGKADSPFFLNELEYLRKGFDEITIFSYPVSQNIIKVIQNKYKIKCEIVKTKYFSWNSIKHYMRWLKTEWVKKEIETNVVISKKGFLKLIYILLYGKFAVTVYQMLEKEVEKAEKDTQIYLYSYWLSRPAYALSYFKELNSDKIYKTFSRAHRYDLYEYANNLKYLPFRQSIANAMDAIYFISQDGLRYFKSCAEIKKNDLKMMLNYLGTYNKRGLCKNVDKKDEIVIASCSAIIPVKRLDLIINALEKIKTVKVTWVHIGVGELFNKIRKEAESRLPHIKVEFLGYVDNSRIVKLYVEKDVDYFINLSDSEGIPVSIMEAMSVGIPVIARNVGGINEIVNESNGCLLDDNYDMDNIINFIELRVKEINIYKRYSEAAKEYWFKYFNAETNYEHFINEVTGSLEETQSGK